MESANCQWNPQIVSGVRNCKWNPHFVCGFYLHLRIPLIFCGFFLQFAESRTTSYNCFFCGIRNKTILPTRFTLKVYVRGIHLHFGTCLKIGLWNPRTYKHKIVRLYSAQFGLVVMFYPNLKRKSYGTCSISLPYLHRRPIFVLQKSFKSCPQVFFQNWQRT